MLYDWGRFGQKTRMPWVSGISLFKVGMGLTGRSYAFVEPDILMGIQAYI